jgi:nuclear transport factor 2 (NTF2) superfamily protein
VRFAYEYRDDRGHWFRAYGNENWRLDADGLMAARFASINEHPIARPNGSSAGRWVPAPTTTPASATSASDTLMPHARLTSLKGAGQ